ncbi:uncharacterized protein LOC113348896 [Papaver somniferum]|uniref:uncharacterized protein LOC113348896 n=1 Tax=Papaver somniferum TaxID=3469 RepID=UPI000E6FAE8A|nr:uncharacterized protein LOC113348896 [Papaver somniferum]
MQMWLCFKCLHIHAWKKAYTSKLHKEDVIAGPFSGHDAEFLIHGVLKPQAGGVSDTAVKSSSSGVNDAVVGLTLDMLHTVFQRRITTIAWIQLLLLPTCTLNLYVPNCSSEERYGTRKKLQIAAINQSLNVWREPNGCATLVHKLSGHSKPSAAIHKTSKKTKKVSANIAACKKKISYGHYTAAIRVLSSDGLAHATPETLQDLMLKHPPAPPPFIPAHDNSIPELAVDADVVLSSIKSFPKGTSCGRDGLRTQHLLDAFSGAAAVISDELLHSIACVVNLWLSGKCPPSLVEFIASAPLIPLLKPGVGVHPIEVGTIWRRLCSNLLPLQLARS